MKTAISLSAGLLFLAVAATASAADAPIRIQPAAQPIQATVYGPANPDPGATSTRQAPGAVRQASYVEPRRTDRDAEKDRRYACADDKCKQTYAVYNTQTPLQQEQGRLHKD